MTATVELVDPSTGRAFASVAVDARHDIERKLAAADAAQRRWRSVAVRDRATAVRRLGGLLRDEVEEHAARITAEMGKPLAEARAEVLKCATTCDYYADHAEDFLAEQRVETEHAATFVRYDPIGVVLAVMPWNFPYWQVIRFAVPTLVAGNGGLLKHASNVSGSALAIAELIARAGFPAGLFSAVVVDRHDAVDELIADPRIVAVTLTGSERAGSSVAAAAGRALKKTVLELGGSDPFVVLADADLTAVVPLAVRARFINAGQSCLCAKRFIVEAPIVDEFVRLASEEVGRLRLGDPTEPTTTTGPLAKRAFVDDIERQVDESVAQGARIVTGGRRVPGDGFYFEPTVLADVDRTMTVFREETFGPVMPITAAADAEEAIELANDSVYGLAASVWSADGALALEVGSRIESGALFVNGIVVSDPRLPFGGVKLSGYGRELSREGLLEFVNARTIAVDPMPTLA